MMKLNVSPNPGWTHVTVGKLDTWNITGTTSGSGSTILSAAWEPNGSTLPKIGVTVAWSAAVANDVTFELHGSYDGTNYNKLVTFGTKLESDGTGHESGSNAAGNQANTVDLASYPAGLYKIGVKFVGDDAADTHDVYITEQ